jgi:hypothetical protein
MPYYDNSWGNLAFLFGVTAYASSDPVGVSTETVGPGPVEGAQGILESMDAPVAPYAWVMPSGKEASYRAAIELMQDGYRVRVFRFPFRMGERTFEKGTFAVLRTRNPESIGAVIEEVARRHGVDLIEVPDPFTDAGITFGDDNRLAAIPPPLVAVVADWPVTQDHTYGGIRNTLEADFGFTFTPVMLNTLENAIDLHKYTAIVLPHAGMDVRGGPNLSAGYRGLLDLTRLRTYVQEGGTLIAVKGAGAFIADDSILGEGVTFDGWAEHTDGAALRAEWVVGHPSPIGELVPWQPGLQEVGRHMLGAGYSQGGFAVPGLYPVLLSVDPDSRAEIVATYAGSEDRLLLDGFVLDEDQSLLAGRPFAIVAPVGAGRVVYFADESTFRGYWYGLNLMFLNSLLFGPLF